MGRPVGSKDKVKKSDTTPKPRAKRGMNKDRGEAHMLALRNLPSTNHPELLNPDRPLTDKQKLFVKHWAAGETIASAALQAGYNEGSSMAYKLARDPAILKLYNEEKRLYAESCQMTRAKVMEGILEGIEMAKMVADPPSVIRGWREVGLMCGYYEPVRKKIEINVTGDVTMKHLNKMSDAELLKIVKGEATDVAFKEVEDGSDDENGDD